MNTVKGGAVTWRPKPWKDADRGGGEPLSDSDSEEEDFPDDYSTPLGEYVTQGETMVVVLNIVWIMYTVISELWIL